MRELVGRVSALDTEAGAAVRVIAYFDRLVQAHAGLEAIVRGAAMLAELSRLPLRSRPSPADPRTGRRRARGRPDRARPGLARPPRGQRSGGAPAGASRTSGARRRHRARTGRRRGARRARPHLGPRARPAG
ncbi:hypothetical protein ACFSTC_32930 [Nonomuraea ferruginea]